MKQRFWYLTFIALMLGVSCAAAVDDEAAMAARIAAQLQSAGRDQYDAIKDEGRKPIETMQFFGVRSGMTVLDMIAGAGYNAEILSAAVGPSGVVYAQNPHRIIQLIGGARNKAMMSRLENKRLPNVKYMIVDGSDLPLSNSVDMAFSGMNIHDYYHNGGKPGALALLRQMHLALKPGGVLAISDHVGVAGNDNKDLHRIQRTILIDLIKDAGFTVQATSNLLANPNDDHSQSIYTEGLRYHTDRILIRARKR